MTNLTTTDNGQGLDGATVPSIPQLIDALQEIYDVTVHDELLMPVTLHLKNALGVLHGLREIAHAVMDEVDDEFAGADVLFAHEFLDI